MCGSITTTAAATAWSNLGFRIPHACHRHLVPRFASTVATTARDFSTGAYNHHLLDKCKDSKSKCQEATTAMSYREVIPGASLVPVYSPAVKASGTFVFVSGQIALDPENVQAGLVGGGDIQAETEQCLSNLEQLVTKAGSSLQDVVKVNIYILDMSQFSLVNEIYIKYFSKDGKAGNDPPARACVAVHQLPAGAKVEIECTALVR